MFLEPTCPYSVKAYAKLDETLALATPDRVTIKLRLQSQPWHLFSGVVVRTVLARFPWACPIPAPLAVREGRSGVM